MHLIRGTKDAFNPAYVNIELMKQTSLVDYFLPLHHIRGMKSQMDAFNFRLGMTKNDESAHHRWRRFHRLHPVVVPKPRLGGGILDNLCSSIICLQTQ